MSSDSQPGLSKEDVDQQTKELMVELIRSEKRLHIRRGPGRNTVVHHDWFRGWVDERSAPEQVTGKYVASIIEHATEVNFLNEDESHPEHLGG